MWYYQINRRWTPINADTLPENLRSSVFICGFIKFTNTNWNGLVFNYNGNYGFLMVLAIWYNFLMGRWVGPYIYGLWYFRKGVWWFGTWVRWAMEPMVRLLAHRAVDAAGMGVEIVRGMGEREGSGVILSPHFWHSFLFYGSINNSVCQRNWDMTGTLYRCLRTTWCFLPSTGARCW